MLMLLMSVFMSNNLFKIVAESSSLVLYNIFFNREIFNAVLKGNLFVKKNVFFFQFLAASLSGFSFDISF